MAAPVIRIYTTTSARINLLPIKDGQLIFLSDLRNIYFDVNGVRLAYNLIQALSNENQRLAISLPLEGFYYVEETGVLWRYSNGWTQITASDAPQYFYGEDTDAFPAKGKAGLFYVTENGLYIWDTLTQDYLCVSNKTEWKAI